MPVTPIIPVQIEEGASASGPGSHPSDQAASHLGGDAVSIPSRGPAAATVPAQELDQLSEAAAAGPWSVSGARRSFSEKSCVFIDAPSCSGLLVLATGDGVQALEALRDARFVVALVNAYRAGELVPAFAAANPSGGWRPIETAPLDATLVDLWTYWPEHDRWRREADCAWVDGDWHNGRWAFHQYEQPPLVTHWMPLPSDPPSALAGEAEGQDAKGGLVHEHAADLSATPIPSPHPDPVGEAKALLEGLHNSKKPQQHIKSLRKASMRMVMVENADRLLARADAIEAALATLRSTQDQDGEVQP